MYGKISDIKKTQAEKLKGNVSAVKMTAGKGWYQAKTTHQKFEQS